MTAYVFFHICYLQENRGLEKFRSQDLSSVSLCILKTVSFLRAAEARGQFEERKDQKDCRDKSIKQNHTG